jgi:hypothetical protein
MDNPADNSLQAKVKGDQEATGNRTIVRRIEITVEREITTVILRRNEDSSEATIPPDPAAGKDSDDSI